jgi:hypothetical protein
MSKTRKGRTESGPLDQPDEGLVRLLALVRTQVHVVLVAATLAGPILAPDRIVAARGARRRPRRLVRDPD